MPPLSLGQIAELTQAQLIGDPEFLIQGIADLENAQPDEISFLANRRYIRALLRSQAGAVLIPPGMARPEGPQGTRHWLICESPSDAFQQLVNHFYPQQGLTSGFRGIHPTAVIHPEAQVDPSATVGPLCVVDQGAQIGPETVLMGQVWIGAGAQVGAHCLLHPSVVVREGCLVGNRCILQPGAVIGGCGYGYSTDGAGHHQKLAQLGRVVLEDDVEVGANSTIDRARFRETRIGAGTKIDNLVMVAHGVTSGRDCLIVAQTGIAGSTKLGDQVILGGQSACVGHIELASNVTLAARGGATKSILQPGIYGGNPAVPIATHRRREAHLNLIEDLKERVSHLEQLLSQMAEPPALETDDTAALGGL
jgi:UDP-3-O-[3-hydroxymyristoyl] glucosamine N-acyltransferase